VAGWIGVDTGSSGSEESHSLPHSLAQHAIQSSRFVPVSRFPRLSLQIISTPVSCRCAASSSSFSLPPTLSLSSLPTYLPKSHDLCYPRTPKGKLHKHIKSTLPNHRRARRTQIKLQLSLERSKRKASTRPPKLAYQTRGHPARQTANGFCTAPSTFLPHISSSNHSHDLLPLSCTYLGASTFDPLYLDLSEDPRYRYLDPDLSIPICPRTSTFHFTAPPPTLQLHHTPTMNPHPQPFAGQGRANPHPHANGRQHHARLSAEFRAPPTQSQAPNGNHGTSNGHGPMNVPPPRGPNNNNNNNGGSNGHAQGFGGARSPPSQKNSELLPYSVKGWLLRSRSTRTARWTNRRRIAASHVPCKFFRQGTCQAGAACPFLHGELSQPCKYFQKVWCRNIYLGGSGGGACEDSVLTGRV
jgi:hypothetical protein